MDFPGVTGPTSYRHLDLSQSTRPFPTPGPLCLLSTCVLESSWDPDQSPETAAVGVSWALSRSLWMAPRGWQLFAGGLVQGDIPSMTFRGLESALGDSWAWGTGAGLHIWHGDISHGMCSPGSGHLPSRHSLSYLQACHGLL